MLLIRRFWLLCGLAFAGPALAQSILLEPGDEVAVDVVRNPDLNRKVVIGAYGNIRLPYAGAVQLQGLDLDEARDLVAQRLFEKINVDPASVSLDVIARSPVYVINDGIGSGPITYRPGITVLMAAASVIPPPSVGSRISIIEELETARKPFELDQTQERLALARLRIARLMAEGTQTDFQPPSAELLDVSPERWAELVRVEQESLDARNALNTNQDSLLAEQEVAKETLIVQLQEQRSVLRKRKELLETERVRNQNLSSQGLVRQTRLVSVEGQILDIEFAEIEVLTELGEAQSALAAIQRTRGALLGNRNVIISETLADLRSEEAQLISQVASFRRQISLSSGSADALRELAAEEAKTSAPLLQVFRDGVTLSARPEDLLEPGDVVLIEPGTP